MPTDVRVPTTGNAGEAAVVVDWNVKVGARVGVGDLLVVLETAKSTIDVESPVSGEVLKLMYAVGDEAPEHDVLAVIGAPGELLDDAPLAAAAASNGTTEAMAPTQSSGTATVDGPTLHTEDSPPYDHRRIAASPRAKILAQRNGLELSKIVGSGPQGRIIVVDVLNAKRTQEVVTVDQGPAEPAHSPAGSPLPPTFTDDYVLVPVRGARKVTAQRMQESLQSAAQVTLTRYAKADPLLNYVKRLRAVSEGTSLPKIGVNDLLLFATAWAVTRHPEANSWFGWDGIRQFSPVNLGFAVDTGQALLVPVIPNAAALSLAQIAAAAKASIEKSRAGKLTMPEMDGGTFTVSNLGSLGVHWFTPVLNPPQSCILGVGATHQLHDDGPSLLPLSLTFDHRALDGAAAAAMLAEIASAIEIVDVLAAF
jgi:Pyruvate/2-oxoglutarate dehydrogenase complex, dihydrolipoamide acyltransferase (E2) component, and related enzymes